MSISDEISALCTYFAIARKGSFGNVSKAILLTSRRVKGFPRASKNVLKTRILASRLKSRRLHGRQ